MSLAIPMVRAMSTVPTVRWLMANGRPVERLLQEFDLASAPLGDPLRPISLINAGALLRAIARAEGPDIPCRIVAEADVIELALLGRVALGTRTPSDALSRIAAALPLFCSHELLSVHPARDEVVVRHSYTVRFDLETEHLMLQYAAAMADRLCAMTGATAPRLRRIEIPPHPEHGVGHLLPWFGDGVTAKPDHSISITVDQDIAERRFSRIARDRMLTDPPMRMVSLRGDGTFSSSARIMIDTMLEDGLPSLERLASASGMTRRTLQRRLSEEGTTFSALLSQARQIRAVRSLSAGDETVVSIASELGYKRQASFTRAMRRWAGMSPTQFRKASG